MKRKLPSWCKLVKHILIERELSISELADELGYERPYLSSVINGKVVSQPAINAVSDELEISNDYDAEYRFSFTVMVADQAEM